MYDEKTIKQKLGSYYDQVMNFFIEIYQKYKDGENVRVVAASKQCDKLFKMIIELQDQIPKHELQQFYDNFIFTAEEFAEETESIISDYKSSEKLPRIVIVDYLLFHGRKISRILLNYTNALIESCTNTEYQAELLEDRALHSTNIHIFAELDEPLVLSNEYRRRIQSKIRISRINMHGLQAAMMNALNESIKGTDSTIDKSAVDAIDETLAYMGYETERDVYGKISSGIYYSKEVLAEWKPIYTMEEFMEIYSRLTKGAISLDSEILLSLL